MYNSKQIAAFIFIVLGIFFLFPDALSFRVWSIMIELLMIFAGLWLVYTGSFPDKGWPVIRRFAGRIERSYEQSPGNAFIQLGGGDIVLNYEQLPSEHQWQTIYISSLFTRMHLRVPQGVSLYLHCSSFLIRSDAFDEQEDRFLSPLTIEEKAQTERISLRIIVKSFAAHIAVDRV